MLSENGDVIKIDTTRRQTTWPWLSKMEDRRYHVASISRQFRGPIYWNAHAPSSFDHAHWGYHSVFKQIRRSSVDGRKRYKNDKCGRKSFLKRSKTAPFSFENGLVWTGPIKRTANVLIKLFNFLECRYKKATNRARRASATFYKDFGGRLEIRVIFTAWNFEFTIP